MSFIRRSIRNKIGHSSAPAVQFTGEDLTQRRKGAKTQREEEGNREQITKSKAKYNYLNFVICYLLPVICFILLFSCDKRSASPKVEIEQSDKELERIADNARRALPIFFRNLARPEAGANNFYVKYPLSADDHTEQVWLGSIRFRNGIYYGNIANTSIYAAKKRVTIDTEQITDWMYIHDGKIIGGRSIKYLLEKIPEEKRSEDQRKILLMFE